jgi:hypothetical protein
MPKKVVYTKKPDIITNDLPQTDTNQNIPNDTNQYEQIIQPNYTPEPKQEIANIKPEPINDNKDEEDEEEDFEDIDNNEDVNENKEVDIITTSSMRSKLKGLETKERVKLLMKRSMSSEKLSKARRNMADKALNEALDIPGVAEMTPEKQIKSDLSKLNLLNNPISKNIDEDVVSVHSRKSRNISDAQSIASDSKISN